MAQLIAQIKQFAVGDGLQPTHIFIMLRLAIAFAIGFIVTALFF